ncbi:MAG TPA: CopD family protein [Stellaceae bacterium]|nr:CopD family protein [Stellaceae bacterium]
MALLLDIFGYLSVVLRAAVLAAQAMLLGGMIFLIAMRPLLAAPTSARCARLVAWSALAFAGAELAFVLLQGLVLVGTLEIAVGEALSAAFARAGLIACAAAAVAAWLAFSGARGGRLLALAVLGLVILAAQVATSHAAARLEDRALPALADFLHMAGAAAWIGGIPYLLIALGDRRDATPQRTVARRFSQLAIAAVTALVAGGLTMAVIYIGSFDALYGTAYGVMVTTKVLLLLGLLLLGGMNYLMVERLRRDPRAPIERLKRFAEVEIGLGLTVLFAAASLTSQPPAVDLVHDRVSWHEMVERFTPQWPRFESPDHASLALSELQAQLEQAAATQSARPQAYVPGEGTLVPRNAEDIAWSEFNHHWAGLFVLAIGALALLERSGRARWARHWPLLFLGLAGFLFVRSDPEVWPLGDVGFFASFRDPEVVQHRIFVVLLAAFALFEWRVRVGAWRRTGAALVFPLLTAVGGALLLTHSHALSNVKEQLLIEITHVPLALCGVTAGWARWVELRLESREGRVAAWVWPIAFVLVGIVLLIYREA